MSEIVLLAAILAGIAVGAAIFYVFAKKRGGEAGSNQAMLMLQNQINELRVVLERGLGQSHEIVQSQFGESHKLLRDFMGNMAQFTEKVTRVEETGKQMTNYAEEMRKLQDILTNTKQRGGYGEYSLELILQNFFPHNYESQHEFLDGTKVDFIIRIGEKLIPIDSKFSLENYNRIIEARDAEQREKLEIAFKNDLKRRIDETAKYIKPSENTMDFALMFIPAEAIYYDLLVNKVGAIKIHTRDLVEYAVREKKVIIVSPTTFLAFLQTVLQGLNAMHIEETAKEIIKFVDSLGRHLASYEDNLNKLGKNLGTTFKAYNQASHEFRKIDKDIVKITGSGFGADPVLLDKPEELE